MSDHDPLCSQPMTSILGVCDCHLIAKVRADERERQEDGWAARLNSTVAWAENGVRADLRTKVEALRTFWRAPDIPMISRDEVLALFDGSSDE